MGQQMHIAVHPIGLRGAVLEHLESFAVPYETFYWREVRDGKALIGWDIAHSMLGDYNSIGDYAGAPCVVHSPLTHTELLDAMKTLSQTRDLPGNR